MPTLNTPRRDLIVAAALLTGTAWLLVAAPGSAMAQDACAGARAAPSAQTLDRAAGAVVCLVNADRARHGLRALQGDGDLRQAAGRHSRNMVRRGFFAHVAPTGADLRDRLRRSGYVHGKPAWHAGETIGWGAGTPSTPARIVTSWIESPSHHRILLGRSVRDVGVGVAAGTPQATSGATYTLDTGVRAIQASQVSRHRGDMSKELV